MDPVTTSALATVLSGVLGGATGEAGAQALQALLRLVRSAGRTTGDAEPSEIELAVSEGDVEHAEKIAEYLLDSARTDPEFERELQAWYVDARSVLRGSTVNNTIAGDVHGNVVQAGVIRTDSGTKK